MAHAHLSLTALSLLLAVTGALAFGAILLYGSWIDGRRQNLRKKGLHPVTGSTGQVHAREEEDDDVGKRS